MTLAGTLDRRVQVRRATTTDDGFQQSEAWADHGAPLWASRRDVSDGEKQAGGSVAAFVAARFRVRHSAFTAALTPKDRLVCDGREWEVVGLKELGRRELIEITAVARTDTATP